jgi:hypothetical protein
LYKIYNYEKENYKHGSTCSNVHRADNRMCRKASFSTTATTSGRTGATAAANKVMINTAPGSHWIRGCVAFV